MKFLIVIEVTSMFVYSAVLVDMDSGREMTRRGIETPISKLAARFVATHYLKNDFSPAKQ
jgi:hypothetical protein